MRGAAATIVLEITSGVAVEVSVAAAANLRTDGLKFGSLHGILLDFRSGFGGSTRFFSCELFDSFDFAFCTSEKFGSAQGLGLRCVVVEF